LCEMFGAMLTGMAFSHQLLVFHGGDMSTRRHLGHFFLVMKPEAFIDASIFDEQMGSYLKDLRQQDAMTGSRVMAPGDREWKVQQDRSVNGIPVDPVLLGRFGEFARKFDISELLPVEDRLRPG